MELAVFALFAAAALGSAIVVVTHRNPVHATMSLVVTLLSTAVMFVLLGSPFLAALQVLLYTGAILVLFLFVIMLLNLTPTALVRIDRPRAKVLGLASSAFFVAFVLFAAMGSSAWREDGTASRIAARTARLAPLSADVLPLSDQLFDKHLLPFEVASVLLLVAIVGAVVLTKRKL
jgi:NADH-quinone oxidoreductase subunit J